MMGRVREIELSMDECPLDMELTNTFREDTAKPSISRQAVLANAPEVEAGCISVPKTLGKEE
jgi:aspartyl/glutamyl-tRNA(Asn/Gln) amidotransferase C subunit